jgi:hypothetical protein
VYGGVSGCQAQLPGLGANAPHSLSVSGTKETDLGAREAAAQAAEKGWQQTNSTPAQGPLEGEEANKRQRRGRGWIAPKKGVSGERVLVDLEASPGRDADRGSFEVLETGSKVPPAKQPGRLAGKREEVNLTDATPITKFFRKREGATEERMQKAPRFDLSTPECSGAGGARGLEGFRFEGKGIRPERAVDGDGWEVFAEGEEAGNGLGCDEGDRQKESAGREGNAEMKASSRGAPVRFRGVAAPRGWYSTECTKEQPGCDNAEGPQTGSFSTEDGVGEQAGTPEMEFERGEGSGRGLEGSDAEDETDEESDPEWTKGMRSKRMKWERKTRGRKKGGKQVVREDSDSEDLLELDAKPGTRRNGNGTERSGEEEGEQMDWGRGEREPQKEGGIRKYFLRKGAKRTDWGGNEAEKAGAASDLEGEIEAERAAHGGGILQYMRRGKKRKRSPSRDDDLGPVKEVAFKDPDWRGGGRYAFEVAKVGGPADPGESEVEWQRRVQWMREPEEEGQSDGRLETKRQRRSEARASAQPSEAVLGSDWRGKGGGERLEAGPSCVPKVVGSQGVGAAAVSAGVENAAIFGGGGLQRNKSDVSEGLAALHLQSGDHMSEAFREPGGSSEAGGKRKRSSISLHGEEEAGHAVDAPRQKGPGVCGTTFDAIGPSLRRSEGMQANAVAEGADNLAKLGEGLDKGVAPYKLTEEELQAGLRLGLGEELGELGILPSVRSQSQSYGAGGHNRSRRVVALSSQESFETEDGGDTDTETEAEAGPDKMGRDPVSCPFCEKVFPHGMGEEALNAHANECIDQSA